MPEKPPKSRRDFLKKVAATTIVTTAAGSSLFGNTAQTLKPRVQAPKQVAPNERVRIATIGMGIIGFIDTETALRVPGVELVAAADLYEGRRIHTQEVYGPEVDVYVDYREILARDDVDAVLICVPDHWHAQMAADAMRAGKAVYCEKPMVQDVNQGLDVIAVQKETGATFQVGSQYASSILYDKAKELVGEGAIGQLITVEARMNRNSAIGAWQYSIPTDASPETVDWDRFLGDAPQRPFDATRFFRWRNYQDYGTAVAGDLYVHLFTGIHHVLDALGPTSVVAKGGLRYWKDGRDVYDIIMALLDYPETETHPAFTMALQTNFVDGGGGGTVFRFTGTDGVIEMGGRGLTVTREGIILNHSAEEVLVGYNSVRTFSEAQQEAYADAWHEAQPAPAVKPPLGQTSTFEVPNGYDDRYDHFVNFFNSIRESKPVYEDAVYGFRAAAPALLCNQSYYDDKMYAWDPVEMKVVT